MKWDADFFVDGEHVESQGYPGWHIECSVMSQKYLGDEFDIHAGGKDHIFPHHPNERAQCFAASGEGQARYWLHNEFIQVEGEKMSKSEGNFYTVRELIDEGFSGDAIRLYLNSSHYRSETDFSREGLEKAEKELKRIRKAYSRIENGGNLEERAEEVRKEFREEMDDDLNTARAKQVLMRFVNEVNSELDSGADVSERAAEVLEELFGVLGVGVEPDVSDEEAGMADILMDLRDESREREDYGTSDFIRDRLEELGFDVEDTPEGSRWTK